MLKVITDKIEWDGLLTQLSVSFLNSWEWGEVLVNSGQRVERVLVENNKTNLVALLVFKNLPLGRRFVFCPSGPLAVVGEESEEDNWRELIQYVKEQEAVFLKVEPSGVGQLPEFIKRSIKVVRDVNPMATMVLGLAKSLTEILQSFHQKTRYNINLAERKGVSVKWGKNFPVFWKLMKKTGNRDGFALHPEKNYAVAVNSSSTRQLTVCFNNIPVATGCFWIYKDVCYYLYGASDHDYRQLMAPYLVQWEAIKMAKDAGCKYYDFFGIAPRINSGSEEYEYDPKQRYAGVTRFKLGFNGQIVETPGTFDLPTNRFWYAVYCLSRRLRGLKV
jgi:lipid II:glycine glycyltransferase (peptidoglycan interpeptide bridge formation enzyme)